MIKGKKSRDGKILSYGKVSKKKKGVYILLVREKTIFGGFMENILGQKFSHASISLTPSFKQNFGFTPVYGFSREELPNLGKVPFKVLFVPLTDKEYKRAVQLLNDMIKNRDQYKYNISGCIRLFFQTRTKDFNTKFFCSEFISFFVAEVRGGSFRDVNRGYIYPTSLQYLSGLQEVASGSDVQKYREKMIDWESVDYSREDEIDIYER